MKKILALVLAAAMVLALVPMTAMAAEITVDYDSAKSSEANGTNLFNKIMAASNGDTIKIGPGEWTLNDGQTSRITDKAVTLAGSGTDKTTIIGEKYGLVLQNNDPNSILEMTIKDMTIKSVNSWAHLIYAKNNIIVNLENLVLINPGATAILVDSGEEINDATYDGICATVNAKQVVFESGDNVQFLAAPWKVNDDTLNLKYTSAAFNFENCTNIDESKCMPQNQCLGFNNLSVNGDCINELKQPEDTSVEVGESATLTVEAVGEKAETFQWHVDRGDGKGVVAINGATEKTYTTDPVTEENNGYRYYCLINGVFMTDGATIYIAVEAPIPETGDGMGLFVFAGLALISMLGMVVLKKREQF